MKEFKFNHENKSWDRYKMFHQFNGAMCEFETGEVMVAANIQSHHRQMYDKYNIQIVSTTEADCPLLYFDKECTEPVTKAWLTQEGQQELAIDHEQKCAVALRYYYHWGERSKPSVHLGNHVREAGAYWSGAKRMPVPLESIKVQAPNPEYRKQVAVLLNNEVLPAITAMWRLSEESKGYTFSSNKYKAKEKWLDSSAQEIIEDILSEPSDYNRNEAIRSIAQSGFSLPRATTEVDFLYVRADQDDLFSNKTGEE